MATKRVPGLSRVLAGIALLGLITAAACSSSPISPSTALSPSLSPTPSPTPTVAISPSPTARPDPAVAFEQLLDDPDLTARITILDITESTDPPGAIRRTTNGLLEFAGTSERERYEVWVEGKKVESTEFISVGSKEWKRSEAGPWTPSDASDDQPFLSKLNRIEGFQSLGVEAKGGRDLHHLRLAPGLTPDLRDWGPNDPRFSNVVVDLDFWVDDDGIPVYLLMKTTFTYTEGGESIEFERQSLKSFEAVGGTLEIQPPPGV